MIIDGKVLDVTSFMPDHPGGEKAILLYAGRDATEEFNMLHDKKVRKTICFLCSDGLMKWQVIPRYAPNAVIGKLKQ